MIPPDGILFEGGIVMHADNNVGEGLTKGIRTATITYQLGG